MKSLRLFFSLVLVLMIGVTAWASLEKGMMFGYSYLLRERWGIATLADAYCGFFTFFAWVFYKEKTNLSRVIWFAVIMFFGNIGMATYALIQLQKLPEGAGVQQFLLRKAP